MNLDTNSACAVDILLIAFVQKRDDSVMMMMTMMHDQQAAFTQMMMQQQQAIQLQASQQQQQSTTLLAAVFSAIAPRFLSTVPELSSPPAAVPSLTPSSPDMHRTKVHLGSVDVVIALRFENL